MTVRIRLTATLEKASTETTAALMIRAGRSDVVTANAEQRPRICTVIGFVLYQRI